MIYVSITNYTVTASSYLSAYAVRYYIPVLRSEDSIYRRTRTAVLVESISAPVVLEVLRQLMSLLELSEVLYNTARLYPKGPTDAPTRGCETHRFPETRRVPPPSGPAQVCSSRCYQHI